MVCVNYRTPADVLAFCDSVIKFPPTTPWKLVIVNVEAQAADMDAFSEAQRRFRERGYGHQHVVCYDATDNIGYARACNYAAWWASAWEDFDYLAFFNADVTLTEGAIDDCTAAFGSHPDWAVLGPRQIDSKGRVTHAGIFGTMERPKHRAFKTQAYGQYTDVVPAVTVSGAAYFIRRDVWDALTDCEIYQRSAPGAVGAFLPTPHYYEESFCSYHALSHGFTVMYYGPVTIYHEWHQASPVGGWAEQQFPISREIFRKACDDHVIPHD
jgi:GT2 family glycosyltransferase